MKPVEIKDLVTGLLVIIFAAIALGQYGVTLDQIPSRELLVPCHRGKVNSESAKIWFNKT